MNIYFSCSITGGRKDQLDYHAIVQYLLALGHEVPTAHLASFDLEKLESGIDPREIYERDINWVRACDVLIAEVSTPSHGVGYEIAEAVNKGKPVLCLYKTGARVSKIITGNNENGYFVNHYNSVETVRALIYNFLSRVKSSF